MKMVITKATLLFALKTAFQGIYEAKELNELINSVRYILEKSDERERIYQTLFDKNSKCEARSQLAALLEGLCLSRHNPLTYRLPETLVELARLLQFFGDCRISVELIWGAASQAILNYAASLGILLSSQESKRRYDKADIDVALDHLEEFLRKLKELQLSDAEKAKLLADRNKYA